MAGGYGTEHDSEFGFDDTPEDKLPKLWVDWMNESYCS
jgi:hypothetical protein